MHGLCTEQYALGAGRRGANHDEGHKMPPHDPKELARLIAEHLREDGHICPMSLTDGGAHAANWIAANCSRACGVAVKVVVTGLVGWCGFKLFGPF